MSTDLAGEVAVVADAGRGIGRATALRLAGRRAPNCVRYNASPIQAQEVVEEVVSVGGTSFVVQ